MMGGATKALPTYAFTDCPGSKPFEPYPEPESEPEPEPEPKPEPEPQPQP